MKPDPRKNADKSSQASNHLPSAMAVPLLDAHLDTLHCIKCNVERKADGKHDKGRTGLCAI